MPTLAYSFRKPPRESPGLTSPSDGRIAVNTVLGTPSHHMHYGGIWDLMQVFLKQKLATEVLLHYLSKFQGKMFLLKFLLCPGSNPRPLVQGGDSVTESQHEAILVTDHGYIEIKKQPVITLEEMYVTCCDGCNIFLYQLFYHYFIYYAMPIAFDQLVHLFLVSSEIGQ